MGQLSSGDWGVLGTLGKGYSGGCSRALYKSPIHYKGLRMTDWEEWLASRPESVQKLAREFPPGTVFRMPDSTMMHVIGYTENNGVIASTVDPIKDWDGAMNKKTQSVAHAHCLRDAIQKTVQ